MTDAAAMGNATRRTKPRTHDSTVSFEEYRYYAEITRAEQDAANVPTTSSGEHGMFPSISLKDDSEKMSDTEASKDTLPTNPHMISDDEWVTASRAIRTATWLSVFYLITTDILGPFGVP